MSTNYKADFPLLAQRDVAYLDSAATAQRPQCVLDVEREFYTRHNANPLRGLYPLSIEATEALESARAAVARFLGAAQSEEIVFTRNTTEGLNLVAYSYGLSHVKAGDEILISTMEHHSNILPWQMVCCQTGAQLKFMECEPDGSLDLNKVEALITARTRVVALQQVSNVLGREYPIRAVAELAHRVGAVLVVDGAQSMPHLPVNVQELGADFLAFSGHKLYGPMGIGALYGRRELLEEMPPFLTGGEMIESVTREGAAFAEAPHKFEAGTVNAAGAAGLHAAIDYVERVGFDTIHARELAVTADALARMRALPHVRILGSDKAEEHNGILTFVVDNVHPHDVSELLAADGVAVRAGITAPSRSTTSSAITPQCARASHSIMTKPMWTGWSAAYPPSGGAWAMTTNPFYNEILTEHNVRPEFKHDLPDADLVLDGVNPSCGDEIQLKLKLDGDTIADGAFVGDGCAISQASTDIMLGMIVGKSREEALRLGDLFLRMIRGEASEEEIDSLEEASALRDVSHMPARVKCAMLGWRTLREALGEKTPS